MYLLDTNMLRLLIESHPSVVRRVAENLDRVWISTVVAEEQVTGRMSDINKARAPRTSLSLSRAHEQFAKTLEDLRILPLFSYGDAAHSVYKALPAKAIRSGGQDSRIAAQAIAHGMIVVTRNVRDFDAIGATCEDWSTVLTGLDTRPLRVAHFACPVAALFQSHPRPAMQGELFPCLSCPESPRTFPVPPPLPCRPTLRR